MGGSGITGDRRDLGAILLIAAGGSHQAIAAILLIAAGGSQQAIAAILYPVPMRFVHFQHWIATAHNIFGDALDCTMIASIS